MKKIPKLPAVVLSNGLVVANYSSPHPFLFEDESVLDACSNERATLTAIQSNEVQIATTNITRSSGMVSYVDVRLDWELTWFVQEDMNNIVQAFVDNELPWDIIITPMPVMIGWKKYRHNKIIHQGPFRTGRLVDRLEPKRLSISKFCII